MQNVIKSPRRLNEQQLRRYGKAEATLNGHCGRSSVMRNICYAPSLAFAP